MGTGEFLMPFACQVEKFLKEYITYDIIHV